MGTYFSTFISGLAEVVVEVLKKESSRTSVLEIFDGLIVWETDLPDLKTRQIKYLNNSYHLIKQVHTDNLEFLARDILADPAIVKNINMLTQGRRTSFRIMFSDQNKLVSFDNFIINKLEDKIKSANLQVNRTDPRLEFLLLSRSEEECFFGLRITKKKIEEKLLPAGQLRTELAHVLVLLSEPKSTDMFLDPFAGYGALPLARTDFPVNMIIAGDNDPQMVSRLKNVVSKFGKKLKIESIDAAKMDNIADNCIDKIVTDPPWGLYQQENISGLYTAFMEQARRVLKPHGIMVLLTAQKDVMDNVLRLQSNFKLISSYDILVSGKKAKIYKITKV